MGLIATGTGGGKDFDPIPAGVQVARCITVCDFGMQPGSYKGVANVKHKVWIAFEVPGFRVKWTKDDVEHEGPGIIGSTYTNSINERAILGQHLVNWRGRAFTEEELKAFDLFAILDKPCQLSVVHAESGGKTYANIGGIMGLPKGMQAPARESDLLAYTPGDEEYAKNLSKLPTWMQEKVAAGFPEAPVASQDNAPDYAKSADMGQPGDDFDDDIPF